MFLITHHRRGGSGGGDAEGDGDDGDLDLNNIDLEPATPEHVKPAGSFYCFVRRHSISEDWTLFEQ